MRQKSRLEADLERLTEGIAALRHVHALMRGRDMGKLSSLAERIKDTKERLEAEADKLALKLDDIDATAPKAFDRGHAYLDSQKAEVAEIEDTLRQLSNLPLESLSSDSGKPAGELKPAPAGLPKAPTLNASQGSVAAQEGAAQPTFPDGKPF